VRSLDVFNGLLRLLCIQFTTGALVARGTEFKGAVR
jgi:hypothetical protein